MTRNWQLTLPVLACLINVQVLLVDCRSVTSKRPGTDTPIVGVLTQEVEPAGNSKSYLSNNYIAASYVKYLESAGARVVPIWIGQNDSYYEKIVKYTNGILFPGGDINYTTPGGYADAAARLYKYVVEENKNGHHVPLWGTCLGLEVIASIASGAKKDVTMPGPLNHVAVPVHFEKGYSNSRMFQNCPKRIVNLLKTKPVTYHAHNFTITRDVLKQYSIENDWEVTSTSVDEMSNEFISTMEHKTYPIYAVMFHPERVQFEFIKNVNIPHTPEAIQVSQYFANFFVGECRKNDNKFPSEELETKYLIYNYQTNFTLPLQSVFMEKYIFNLLDPKYNTPPL